jgi:hypothetical protein
MNKVFIQIYESYFWVFREMYVHDLRKKAFQSKIIISRQLILIQLSGLCNWKERLRKFFYYSLLLRMRRCISATMLGIT